MNGPRTKGEAELAWAAIKRGITAEVNYEMQCRRERELNARLESAWKDFKAALDNDLILQPHSKALELEA